MIRQHVLDDWLFQLRKLKAQADKAMAQIDDAQFFALIDADANSIALIVKHVAGNMRSRWTDFLTTDGEKPDRDRDSEFETAEGTTRADLLARWEEGWSRLFGTLASLTEADLTKTVTIRSEPHTVVRAINRSLTHAAYHVGQIVFLCKVLVDEGWQTLSVPRGGSAAFNEKMAAKTGS